MIEGRRRRRCSIDPTPQVVAQWTEEQRQDYHLQKALDLPLADVPGLSTRTVNTLENEGILLIRELVHKKVEELLSYKNFGETTLVEIRNAIKKLGIKTTWRLPNRRRK